MLSSYLTDGPNLGQDYPGVFGKPVECNYYIRFFECFLRIRLMGSVIQSRFHLKIPQPNYVWLH